MCTCTLLQTRKAAVEPILDVMMRDGLAAYYAAAPEARNPILKEGLMYLIQDLNRWLTECKQRRKFVETMLVTHITPELASPVACLRARACAVWGAYCGARFTDKATITNAVTGVYQVCVRVFVCTRCARGLRLTFTCARALPLPLAPPCLQCLNDKEMVVRITAGGVLNAFLMQSKVARKMLKPHVTDVLGKLFSLLEELGVDEVRPLVRALPRTLPRTLPCVLPHIDVSRVWLPRDAGGAHRQHDCGGVQLAGGAPRAAHGGAHAALVA
ncbi:hypothetical protein EON68_00930 [archaeon]|nr:MAG: hypothetical protein EON68_00930 [archaeon]